MEFLIVTGMSGAGKTTVRKYLEDWGYYCVDNLPPALISKFAGLCLEGQVIEKPVMFLEIRDLKTMDDLTSSLEYMTKSDMKYKILFLDCSNEVLVKRYKENRRMHPLSRGNRVLDNIIEDRELLSPLKEIADVVIDTTNLSVADLKEKINEKVFLEKQEHELTVSILSFGFKYGIPIDCDLVFDVRFIPNPFYIKDMRNLSGLDKVVEDFVLGADETIEFNKRVIDLLKFLIPNYKKEGKSQIVIGIGCTGGRHRSVAIAEYLYKQLSQNLKKVTISHRDIEKDGRSKA